MGKRAGRKLTREAKIANPQIFLKREIGKGIESGAPLKNIAYLISTKFHIQKQMALKMVMAEYDIIAKDWMDLDAQAQVESTRQAVNL
jgi:hypothetical protein